MKRSGMTETRVTLKPTGTLAGAALAIIFPALSHEKY